MMTVKEKTKKDIIGLRDKYYSGKRAKKQKAQKTEIKARIKKINGSKSPTRNDLMLQAKAKGVKNFRVINKEELTEILKPITTQARIDELVKQAVTRWKMGWNEKPKK